MVGAGARQLHGFPRRGARRRAGAGRAAVLAAGVLLLPLPPAAAPRELRSGDSLVSPDKGKHLVVSALMVGALYRVCREELRNGRGDSRAFAAGLTAGAGVAKELHDARFSVPDLAADAAGITLGIALFTQ